MSYKIYNYIERHKQKVNCFSDATKPCIKCSTLVLHDVIQGIIRMCNIKVFVFVILHEEETTSCDKKHSLVLVNGAILVHC